MSPVLVPVTLPFAMAAAFYPAGLVTVLWLLAVPPGRKRALIYLAGAASMTVASGVAILAMLHGIREAPGRQSTIEGAVQVGIGALLVTASAVLLVRRPKPRSRVRTGRLGRAGWLGIFLLGVVMWTPSFAYLAALELIVDSGLGFAGQAVNLVVVDVVVLSSVELPLLTHSLAPVTTERALGVAQRVMLRYAWQLGAFGAGAGGIYLLVRGATRLIG